MHGFIFIHLTKTCIIIFTSQNCIKLAEINYTKVKLKNFYYFNF